MKQCEPDPQFQIALLHIIRSQATSLGTSGPNTVLESQSQGESSIYPSSGGTNPAQPRQPTPEEIQIQYQAIICMKNSLTRLL